MAKSRNTAVGEVTIPRTEQRIKVSRTGNREYRIFVAVPEEEPPTLGYPVIYLLDANALFGTMVEAIRVQGQRPEKTGVVPAVIVGIGYRTQFAFDPARHYDFTLPAPAADLPARPDGGALPEQGGADAFLRFIEEELKPEIERDYRIDRSRQTIFGHSLGGLFVLHALFTRPESFRTYIAGSPSIHWNKQLLLNEEQMFVNHVALADTNVDILLATGGLERSHKSGMAGNAKELAARLSALASHGVRVEFKEFEGESHTSVLPALISRSLRFALSPAY